MFTLLSGLGLVALVAGKGGGGGRPAEHCRLDKSGYSLSVVLTVAGARQEYLPDGGMRRQEPNKPWVESPPDGRDCTLDGVLALEVGGAGYVQNAVSLQVDAENIDAGVASFVECSKRGTQGCQKLRLVTEPVDVVAPPEAKFKLGTVQFTGPRSVRLAVGAHTLVTSGSDIDSVTVYPPQNASRPFPTVAVLSGERVWATKNTLFLNPAQPPAPSAPVEPPDWSWSTGLTTDGGLFAGDCQQAPPLRGAALPDPYSRVEGGYQTGAGLEVSTAEATTGDFTAAAWVRWLRPGDWDVGDHFFTVFATCGAEGCRSLLALQNGQLRLTSPELDGGVTLSAVGVPLEPNDWHHLGLVGSAGKLTLVLDGREVDRVGAKVPAASTLVFGGKGLAATNPREHSFPARLDDLKLWRRALSAKELATELTTPQRCEPTRCRVEREDASGGRYTGPLKVLRDARWSTDEADVCSLAGVSRLAVGSIGLAANEVPLSLTAQGFISMPPNAFATPIDCNALGCRRVRLNSEVVHIKHLSGPAPMNLPGGDAGVAREVVGANIAVQWNDPSPLKPLLVFRVDRPSTPGAPPLVSVLEGHDLGRAVEDTLLLGKAPARPLPRWAWSGTPESTCAGGPTLDVSAARRVDGRSGAGYALRDYGLAVPLTSPVGAAGLWVSWDGDGFFTGTKNQALLSTCSSTACKTVIAVDHGFLRLGAGAQTLPLQPRAWVHLVVVERAGTLTLYADAVEVASTPGSLAGQQLVFGGHKPLGSTLNNLGSHTAHGLVDDLEVWSQALTPAEVAAARLVPATVCAK